MYKPISGQAARDCHSLQLIKDKEDASRQETTDEAGTADLITKL